MSYDTAERGPLAWRGLRYAVVGALYLLLFLPLQRPGALLNLEPVAQVWNPAAAITWALLLLRGPIMAPVVVLGNFIDLGLDWPANASWTLLLAASAAPALVYAGAAWLVRRLKGPTLWQAGAARVFRWLLLVAATTALVGAGVGVVLEAADAVAQPRLWQAARTIWLGDLAGVLALLPFLLLLLRSDSSPWSRLRRLVTRIAKLVDEPRSLLLLALEAAGVSFCLWIVYGWRELDQAVFLYPLFVPLLWLTVRHGFSGAVVANLGLTAGTLLLPWRAANLGIDPLELQAFLITLAAAGLLLGAALSDERRARRRLGEQEDHVRDAQRRREVAEAMREIVAMVNAQVPIAAVLEAIAEQAAELLGTDNVGLFLLEADEQLLSIAASSGIPERYLERLRLPVGSGAVGQAVRDRKPVVVQDLGAMVEQDELRWGALAERDRTRWFLQRFKTILAVPLLAKERALGGMSLYYLERREIRADEIELALSFADQAALALENARLHRQAQELAVLQERQRIARELHDSVAQALYGISLGARTAIARWQRQRDGLDEPLEYIQSLADSGLADMRALIFELRPEALEADGLKVTLERLVQAADARSDVELRTNLAREPQAPIEVKEAFYRIAQQALNNALKHARAAEIKLDLSTEKGVTLRVDDDGIGFDSQGSFPGHLGLRSMRERAERIGAELVIDSRPGAGTRVELNWSPEPDLSQ